MAEWQTVVWKHELPIGKGSFELELPRGWSFCSLGVQRGQIVLWEEHFPNCMPLQTNTWRFHCRDTGQPLELGKYQRVRYLGTVQLWLDALKVMNTVHVWVET